MDRRKCKATSTEAQEEYARDLSRRLGRLRKVDEPERDVLPNRAGQPDDHRGLLGLFGRGTGRGGRDSSDAHVRCGHPLRCLADEPPPCAADGGFVLVITHDAPIVSAPVKLISVVECKSSFFLSPDVRVSAPPTSYDPSIR